MPGRPPLRAALLALALLSGCTSDPAPAPSATGPVEVAVGVVDAVTAQTCRRLVSALPDEVDPGVTRRPVTGDAGLTAAWGDPPVTLQCGVPEPERPEAPVTVNGVEWSVRNTSTGSRWTTRGRSTSVQVDVPEDYPNAVEIVNPLSGPVAGAIPTPAP